MQVVFPKDSDDRGWEKVKKVAVTSIRLKHSLRADDEINEVIPKLQQRYIQALNEKQAFELDSGDFMEELEAVAAQVEKEMSSETNG